MLISVLIKMTSLQEFIATKSLRMSVASSYDTIKNKDEGWYDDGRNKKNWDFNGDGY